MNKAIMTRNSEERKETSTPSTRRVELEEESSIRRKKVEERETGVRLRTM